jgi:hypothetical protein
MLAHFTRETTERILSITIYMGIPLTITMGILLTMVVGIQFTVSNLAIFALS